MKAAGAGSDDDVAPRADVRCEEELDTAGLSPLPAFATIDLTLAGDQVKMALGLSWLLAAEAPANRLQAVPDGTSRHKRARRQTAPTEKMSGASRFFASGDYCSRTVHRLPAAVSTMLMMMMMTTFDEASLGRAWLPSSSQRQVCILEPMRTISDTSVTTRGLGFFRFRRLDYVR